MRVILLFLFLTVFLGIFSLYKTKEGLDTEDDTKETGKPSISAEEGKKLASSITSQMVAAGIPMTVGTEVTEIFNQFTGLIEQEFSMTSKKHDEVYQAEQSTPAVNTVAPTFASQTFFTGSKFGDAFCKTYTNRRDLSEKCAMLNVDSCNMTDCCIWLNGEKCAAGTKDGPIDINGVKVDSDYYSYKYSCYGGGCPP